uniref:Uncharacterized protein n=1 Tax=Rhizophora mucronata TaxID=61149 RepID=A0A2P2NBY8_RHIMU
MCIVVLGNKYLPLITEELLSELFNTGLLTFSAQ